MVILTAVVVGCAPTTRSNWEPTAWHVQENKSSVPEIGTLQDEQFNYDIVATDLRKVIKIYDPVLQLPEVTKHPKTMIAIAVRCRNRSNGALILDADPIQMIDPFRTLAKKLTREEVIFKLYGGRMQEASQLGMLEELQKPVRTSSTFFGAVLAAYIAAQRADARAFIINEMYQKEYAAYDIFHHSFEPSSLPNGVSTDGYSTIIIPMDLLRSYCKDKMLAMDSLLLLHRMKSTGSLMIYLQHPNPHLSKLPLWRKSASMQNEILR